MGNKLKMKDIITLAIFNVAILVVMVVVKMVIMMVATPAFNYLAYGSFITSYVAHRIFLLYGNGKKL